MKNIEPSRFRKLLARDLRTSWPLFRTTFLIICALPVTVWLLNIVLGDYGRTELSPVYRRWSIYVTMLLATMMASSRIFRTVNVPNQGIYYAMLPASKAEKMWSQVLVCYLAVPLATLLAGVAIDLLLTLLPFGAYVDWLWNDWPQLAYGHGPFSMLLGSAWLTLTLLATWVLAQASTFFFTNTVFKKNKVAKTLLWLVLISFLLTLVFSLLSSTLLRDRDPIDLLGHRHWDQRTTMLFAFWVNVAIHLLYSALLTWWGARRLRKMSY